MKKPKRWICLVLVISVGAAGFILLSKYYETENEPTGFISLTEMENDYNYFFDFVKTEYPFRGVCKRAGVNFEFAYNKHKQKLTKIKTELEYYNFYWNVINDLTHHKNFGHFSPVGMESCLDGKAPPLTLSPELYETKIKKFYDTFILQNKQLHVSKNIAYQMLHSKFDVDAFKYMSVRIYKKDNIAYLQLDDFGDRDLFEKYNPETIVELYKQEFMNFLIEAKKYNDVIIDLRNCSGGIVQKAELLSSLLGGTKRNTLTYRLLYSSQSTYLEQWYTRAEKQILQDTNNGYSKEMPQLYQTNREDSTLFDTVLTVKSSVPPQKEIFNYSFRVWVLVSKTTASAADIFAVRMKTMRAGTIIGVPTNGDGFNYGAGFLLLPQSGLLIRSDLFYGLNPDGSCNSELGTVPDIYNLPGKDALQTCLEEIKKLKK